MASNTPGIAPLDDKQQKSVMWTPGKWLVSSALVVLVLSVLVRSLAIDDAVQAYYYGYPLLMMNHTQTAQLTRANMTTNTFFHVRGFMAPSDHTVVKPNTDTLYSSAWLNLTQGPLVLHMPEVEDSRYVLMQFMDSYTNVFAAPGSRTTGSRASKFLILSVDHLNSTTFNESHFTAVFIAPQNLVWLLGRTYVDASNPADFDQVHKIQDHYKLTDLEGSELHPSVTSDQRVSSSAASTGPAEIVDNLEIHEYFNQLAELMCLYPPPASLDKPMLDKLKGIGLVPCMKFNPPTVLQPLLGAVRGLAKAAVLYSLATNLKTINGWRMVRSHIGSYGTNYAIRAGIANQGFGANLPNDAIYGSASAMGDSNKIVFPAGGLPPARSFWSVTVYDNDGFFYDNPEHKYTVHSADPYEVGPDGSLTIYFSKVLPSGVSAANWIPVPGGWTSSTFLMRLYWPEESALNGTWNPPAVQSA